MKKLLFCYSWLLITVAAAAQTNSPLRVANIFTTNMVLQQQVSTPVWGLAAPGEQIRVSIDGKEKATVADGSGKWLVKLTPLKAGGPYQLRVQGADSAVLFDNVLAGEVWLASGQSNMAFTLKDTDSAQKDIATANYPEIRMYTMFPATAAMPNADIPANQWRVCQPPVAGWFTAVGYHFARALHTNTKVPVGIINASWGGSSAEAWLSRHALLELPDFRERMLQMDTDTTRWNARAAKSRSLEKQRAEIAQTAKEGLRMGVHEREYADAAWPVTQFPITMTSINRSGYWGFIWFRQSFHIDAAGVAGKWQLQLPVYSNEHQLYLNGREIAHRTNELSTSFDIPEGLLQAGANTLAIRIRTYFGTGRIGDKSIRQPPMLHNPASGKDLPLSGDWKYNLDIEPKIAAWQDYFNTPTVIYNAMIAPLMPYAIKGVIWYQGENNVGKPIQYRSLFPALIRDWRRHWQQDFPFLFVQLAAIQKEGIADIQLPLLREAQAMALQLPNTGMATAIDLGLQFDIHPKNKRDVGERLCLAARKVAYKEKIISSGPAYQSMKKQGQSIRLSFSSTGTGLLIHNNAASLTGFTIAGADSIFHPAIARIEGKEVIVSSPLVARPLAVRYCFESWPRGNLYNKEGLPASPFRTDRWDILGWYERQAK